MIKTSFVSQSSLSCKTQASLIVTMGKFQATGQTFIQKWPTSLDATSGSLWCASPWTGVGRPTDVTSFSRGQSHWSGEAERVIDDMPFRDWWRSSRLPAPLLSWKGRETDKVKHGTERVDRKKIVIPSWYCFIQWDRLVGNSCLLWGLWNLLPQDVITATNLVDFKRRLDKFMESIRGC